MSGNFTPELNGVKIQSPTEDGKLAYVMNTMVPRRLDQFDDIRADLEKRDFNTDKAYFYVNFQAGDFCGRSYKLPLSELNEFVTESILFGTNGNDPIMTFQDGNFYVDDDNNIHLIILPEDIGDIKDPVLRDRIDKLVKADAIKDPPRLLINTVKSLEVADERQENRIGEVHDELDSAVNKFEAKKADKFYILGSGDKLNSEGLPEPKPVTSTDPFGVHVTVNPKDKHGNPIYEGPDLGDGTKGPVILIDHDEVVPKGGWITRFNVGGYAKDQLIPEGTRIVEVIRQILLGDPKQDNVLCAAVINDIDKLEAWTDIPWIQFSVKRNELWHPDTFSPITGHAIPFERWRGISSNHQYIAIALPLSMIHEDSGTDELRVRLNEVYDSATPEITVPFRRKDIKGSPTDLTMMYRVYYLAEPVTMYFDKLVFEFTYNDPTSPDYEN